MTISTEAFLAVGVGTSANDGTGDSLRAAFIKVNSNFSNIGDIGFDAANINVTGSIEVAGNVTSAYFIGDGSQLTGVVSVATTNVAVTAQYVTANAQANITSVGNLTSLSSGGNIQTTRNVIANTVYASSYLNSDGSNPFYPFNGNINVRGNLIVANSYVPASNTAVGTAGQIVWDSGNIYVCVATNTWKRAALTSTF